MRTTSRVALSLFLALALAAAATAGDDAKKLESTPQAKVYRVMLKAIDAGDFEAYKKSMTKEAQASIDAQMKEMEMKPADAMKFMKAMAPAELKFTSLKVDGKKATMMATGKVGGEPNNKGTIELAEEAGAWKIGKQSWTNKP